MRSAAADAGRDQADRHPLHCRGRGHSRAARSAQARPQPAQRDALPNPRMIGLRAAAHADAAEPADAVAHLRGADPGLPAVARRAGRLWRHLRALLPGRASPIISTAISPAPRATVSRLGQFLDPIADKIMVAAVIVMLIARPSRAGGADHRDSTSSRPDHPAARDHRLGPARIPRRACRSRCRSAARQVEDDASSSSRSAR